MHIDKRIISRFLLLSLIVSNFANPLTSYAENNNTQNEINKLQEENSISATLTGEQILDDMEKQEKNEDNSNTSNENKESKEETKELEEETKELEEETKELEEESNENTQNISTENEIMPMGIYDNAIDYYNTHPNGNMEYLNGSFYYGTRFKTASSSTVYRTVGYQISVEREGFLFYDRVKIGGTLKQLDVQTKDGYQYLLYRMDIYNGDSLISRMKGRHGHQAVFERIVDPDQVTDFEFNPVFTVAEGGKQKGDIDWEGNLSGEVYLTAKGYTSVDSSGKHLVYPSGYSWSLTTSYDTSKKGINGARGWGQSAKDQQAAAFNRRSQIYGNSIPVWRNLHIRHIAEESGAILNEQWSGLDIYGRSANLWVNTNSYANRQVVSSNTYHDGSHIASNSRSGGFNQSMPKMVTTQRIDIYYRLMLRDKGVTVKHHIYGSSTKVHPDEWYNVTGVPVDGRWNTFYTKNTNEYTVRYNETWRDGSCIAANDVWGDSSRSIWIGYDGGYTVIFYYTRSIPSDTTGSGSISFSPASTGWVNSNININIRVNGTTKITKYGTANRTLYYSGGSVTVPSTTVETWEINNLYVWGNGKNANNGGVGYNAGTYANNSTFTISQESKQGELGAKVNSWKRTSTAWLHSYPVSTSGVTAATSAPTYTYETYSKGVSNGGTYNLDKTKPSVWVDKTSQWWTNQNVTVNVSASDNLSGVNTSRNELMVTDESHYNKASWWPGFSGTNKSVTLSEDGIWRLHSTVYDYANNASAMESGQYMIDKTKPTASINKTSQYWTNQNIPITVTHSDNLSGVNGATTSITDTSGTSTMSSHGTISPSFTITQDGTWKISTSYYDKANNSNSNTWSSFNLDKTKPQSSINKTSQGWTNQDIALKINHTDNLSGVESASTTITDTSYKPSTSYSSTTISPSMTIGRDGIWRVNTNPVDKAKNDNPMSWAYYHLDKTKPNDAKFSVDNRTYADDPLNITVTVGDNLSGLSEVKYVVNNNPTSNAGTQKAVSLSTAENSNQTATFNFTIKDAGSYYVHVYTKDRAGNEKWTTSQNYKIIKLDPNNAYIYPRAKGVRGTRFDVLVNVLGATKDEVSTKKVMVNITNLPKWFNDAVDKKNTNNQYSVTSGTESRLLKLYAAKSTGTQGIPDSTTSTMVYESTVIPFGTPLTLDRNGNRLQVQNKFTVKLTLDPSFYPVTQVRPIDLYYDIVPEVDLKTEIVSNDK